MNTDINSFVLCGGIGKYKDHCIHLSTNKNQHHKIVDYLNPFLAFGESLYYNLS